MTCYNTAKLIVQKLADAGHTAYYAGGYVRDMLMEHPSDDIDIASSATVEEVEELFEKTIPVGVQFGITIVVEDGHQFEVASFREESDYVDGRRPTKVKRASPEVDAKRRDFTINGMFYDPLKEELLDYVGGQEDLKKEVVRAIGDAHKRFQEDRLRMVRCARYAARFNFAIDPDTTKAILTHASELLPAVAMERIWQELCKMAAFKGFEEALCLLQRFTILGVIFPELEDVPMEEIERRAAKILKHPTESPVIAKVFELFPDHNLQDRLALCDRLKLSNTDRKFTEELNLWHTTLSQDDYEWAKLYAMPHAKTCLEIVALHRVDPNWKPEQVSRIKRLEKSIERIKNSNRIVTSDHLMKLGVKPGIKMGELLVEADRLAVNHNLLDPEEIIKRLELL